MRKSNLIDHNKSEEIIVAHPENVFFAEEYGDRERQERREHVVARLRMLWEKRALLFRVLVIGFVISVTISFLIPTRYTAMARLMPPDNESGSGLQVLTSALKGDNGGIGSLAGNLLGLNSTSDVFVGILTSHTSEDALIQQLDLRKVYSDRHIEDARHDLEDHTSISVDRKSQIITIAVTDRSPQRAAGIAHAYVEELNRLVAELSTSSARRERIFLEDRLQGVTKDLEEAEKEFGQFASNNTAIDVPTQGRAMVESAAVLQGQLIAAQSELEGLRQIYTDSNVRVRSLIARVTELQEQLNKLGGKGDGTTGALGQEGDVLYPSIRRLPLLGIRYADLYRNVKVQEAVFETLTQEYEIAKVEEAKEIPTVKVLDQPGVPDTKSFPPRMLIIILGTLLTLFIEVTWIFAHAGWLAADPSDVRKQFALEVLGEVGARWSSISRNGSSQPALDSGMPKELHDPPRDSSR